MPSDNPAWSIISFEGYMQPSNNRLDQGGLSEDFPAGLSIVSATKKKGYIIMRIGSNVSNFFLLR
jgi:hypothetical protein